MPAFMIIVVSSCAMLLVLLVVWRFRSSVTRVRASIALLALAAYLILLHFAFGFPFPTDGLAKGDTETGTGPLVLALFISMLLGMGSEYLYNYLDTRSAGSRFEWGTFVKPFLVSPLVFVPLAASLQNAKVDLSRFNIPLLMLFLVAFENGFLWRGYFTRKLAQQTSGQ